MKVKSSAFSDIDYDPESQLLTVQYSSGQRYRHEGVPEHVYKQVMESDSIGRAFQQLVKNQFPATKIA
jgi:hypothetical protein